MKIKILLAVIWLLALTITSCKKDGNPDADSSYFKCKVDGKEYNVEGILAYGVHFGDENGIYGLTGNGDQETCFFIIPLDATKGTYTFDTNNRGNFTDINKIDYSSLWGQGSGSVTIEEIDAVHAKGTFQFTAWDGDTETKTKTITDGKFNVAFR